MNILIPHSWLLEHLETKATPEEIQKYVSLSGPSVERIYEREGEPVYDVEVTTNRVDAMSVRGFAREAAVILEQFGIPAKLKPLQLPQPEAGRASSETERLELPKIKNDPKLVKRIMCIVLQNVQRTPTPPWMAKRLQQTEMNVHDSVIDITNYITHELGHPCHAFDYDQLMKLGGEIIVTTAKPGQKFTTLDGLEFTTVGGEVVYLNPAGEIIDLPAIKGTANTSISPTTKNVLLWAETASPKEVRFASMKHAIRTVAAQLSEKGIDPHLAEPTLKRGIELYQELCQATVVSDLYDEFPTKRSPEPVVVTLEQIDAYLGLELPLENITTILTTLGCEVVVQEETQTLNRASALHVTPPTFRPDLAIPADIIEEIARIYGYHNLPSVLMPTAIPVSYPADANFQLENRLKHTLADLGWQELYTYSLVSDQIARQSGFQLDEHLKVQNQLTDDRVYLRRSLLPSLAEVITQNPQRAELSVFELANLYTPVSGQLPQETLHLSLVSNREYRQVRGELEALLAKIFVTGVKIEPVAKNSTQFSQEAELTATTPEGTTERIGVVGVLKSGNVAINITLSSLLKVVRSHPEYQPIPKTMALYEDFTFTLPSQTSIGKVIEALRAQSPLVIDVELKDVYRNNYTLTVSFQDPKQNLTAADIQPLRALFAQVVQKQFSGNLVGEL